MFHCQLLLGSTPPAPPTPQDWQRGQRLWQRVAPGWQQRAWAAPASAAAVNALPAIAMCWAPGGGLCCASCAAHTALPPQCCCWCWSSPGLAGALAPSCPGLAQRRLAAWAAGGSAAAACLRAASTLWISFKFCFLLSRWVGDSRRPHLGSHALQESPWKWVLARLTRRRRRRPPAG